MHERCPVCDLKLERDPGYFVGAMYFSYALGLLVLVPLFFLLSGLLPDWPILAIPTLALVIYLPLVPIIFRYSRVLWIYFDRSASPGEDGSHRDWLVRERLKECGAKDAPHGGSSPPSEPPGLPRR